MEGISNGHNALLGLSRRDECYKKLRRLGMDEEDRKGRTEVGWMMDRDDDEEENEKKDKE